MSTPTIANLQRAIAVSQQIQQLEAELASILGGAASSKPAAAAAAPKPVKTRRRTMSPESRARIVAAQKARWAKIKADKAPEDKAGTKPAAKPVKRKGTMSAEGRASIIAAQKARWAKIKGEKPAAAAVAKPVSKKKGKRTISPEGRAKMAEAAKRRWAKVGK